MRDIKEVVRSMMSKIPSDIKESDKSFKNTLENILYQDIAFVAPEIRWDRFGTEISESFNEYLDNNENIPVWLVQCLSIFTTRSEEDISSQLKSFGKTIC